MAVYRYQTGHYAQSLYNDVDDRHRGGETFRYIAVYRHQTGHYVLRLYNDVDDIVVQTLSIYDHYY